MGHPSGRGFPGSLKTVWRTGAWPNLGFTQTGHAGHLNLNRAAYDRLKARIHRLSRNPALKTPATLAHLQGRLQWLAQLNPAKAARLLARFDAL